MVWTALLPSAWILGLAVVALVLAHWVYRGENPARNRHLRTPAMFLRIGVLLAVLTAFLGPSKVQEEERRVRPRLGILVDASRSMGLTDAGGESTRLDRVKAFLKRSLPDLSTRYSVGLFGFGADVKPLQNLAGLHPIEEASRIRAATHQAMRREILDALLVLTDGREVDPGGVVPALDTSVPLFALGVGSPAGPRDLGLENVAHEKELPPGAPLVVRFDLVKQGAEACRISVLLKQEDRLLARKSVTLGAKERRKRESLAFTPIEAGVLEWILEAEPLPGEANAENNRRSVRAHVRESRTRVLLVEGRPRWEFRHLKNALVRDPTLDVHVLLTNADAGYIQEGSREAPSLHRFPSASALAGYNVILVGDVDPHCPAIRATHRSPETLFHALERYVTRSGGGLALVAGPLQVGAWLSAPGLKNVLPVLRTHPERPWYDETPFHLRLTRAGRRSPLLALLPDPDANLDLLEGRPFRPAHGPLAAPLPPFLGCARNVEAKPGTEVLATAGEAGTPLLVTTQVGAGRVLFSGIEETWLWRREHEDRYFYRFWRQVLHFLARPPWRTPGPVRILTAQEGAGAGARVWVEVLPGGATDPIAGPAPELPDHLLVETPGGSMSSLALVSDRETPRCRTGSFEARCPGDFRIRLVAGGPVRARVRVDPAVRELDCTDPDLGWLGPWVGSGRYAPLEVADGLLKILPGAPRQEVVNRGLEPAWNRLWILLLFVALLTGEWICRLRMRLL